MKKISLANTISCKINQSKKDIGDRSHGHPLNERKDQSIKLSWMMMYLPSAWAAVILLLGSLVNIFLIRSFAEDEMLGHGGLSKSRLPSNTASNMPFSVSIIN